MAKKAVTETKPKVKADGGTGSKTWSGHIVTGPLSIEVAMYAAARTERVGFNMLHAQCQGQIKQVGYHCPCCVEVAVLADFKYQSAPAMAAYRAACTEIGLEDKEDWPDEPEFIVCKKDEKRIMHGDDVSVWALKGNVERTKALVMVDGDQIVKGFEFAKGKFAVVTKAELDALKPLSAKTVEILSFVKEAEVDPIYFEASYYLPPAEAEAAVTPRAYALLRRAMIEERTMAIGRICVRNSENTVFIKPHVLGGFIAYTAYATDEVRQVNVPAEPELTAKEVEAAVSYVRALTAPLDMSEFKDGYRARVMELVEAKKAGGTIAALEPPKPKPAESVDLVQMFSLSAKMATENKSKKQPKGTAA